MDDATSGHETRVGQTTNACRIFIKRLKERDDLEGLGVDWKKILKLVLNIQR